MKKFLRDNATLIALVVLFLGMSFLDASFFTPRNLSNLVRQVTIIGIISVGMTLVILIGGIDLSVGSVSGLAAIAVTLLMQRGLNIWIAIALTVLLTGIVVGLWNGFWIARFKIPPFIITLGMMTIARGLALTFSDGTSVPVTDPLFSRIGGDYIPVLPSSILIILVFAAFLFLQYTNLVQKRQYHIRINKLEEVAKALTVTLAMGFMFYVFTSYQGIPIPVLIFGVTAVLGGFILSSTRFGRRIYAIGGNEEAARLSGINVFMTSLIVYTVVSTLSAMSGILLASRLDGASPNLGNMFELDAIASVVIGGTSLSGGSGTISGTVVGAFIIGVLNNGMSLLGVNMFYQLVIKGFIIIIAVLFDILNKKRRV